MMEAELFKYLAQLMPDAETNCAGCGELVEISAAVMRQEKFYCSETCADRSLALLIKPQPIVFQLEGWDL
jgi:hypothetical protein